MSFVRRPVDLAEPRRRFFARLRAAVGERPIAVWGAGRAGELAIAQLRSAGCAPAWIVDRDTARRGTRLRGLSICAPDEIHRRDDKGERCFVVIASMHARAIAGELENLGWAADRDFAIFPAGSIYCPDFAFLLAETVVPRTRRQVPWPIVHLRASASKPVVTLFASSAGNFFFRELRTFLARGLREHGWTVTEADEHANQTQGTPIVIGPHEFFSVGNGVEWFSPGNLADAVLVTTEQPQSLWFREFLPAFAAASAVVDISPNGAAALTAAGVEAEWLPLGWYAGCDPFDRIPDGIRLPGGAQFSAPIGALPAEADDPWQQRPCDVLCIGSHSPRRERIVANLQAVLPDLAWFVHQPGDHVPIDEQSGTAVSAAEFVALSRSAKVLLNLHRDDAPFWEWQRIVWRGLWQRTLVVTEPTGIALSELVAGRDYVEASPENLASTLRRIFSDAKESKRVDQIRCAGARHARESLPFARAVEVLGRAIARGREE